MSAGENGTRSWRVGAAEAGARIDVFLAARLGLGRAGVRALFEAGAVCLDGRRVGVRHKGVCIATGSQIEVQGFTAPATWRARPEPDAPLRVLAQGAGWIALDKPAGTPVHPLRPDEGSTLLNALAARHPELHGVGEGGLRSGVVHRLDVETSGVLLVALEEPVWQRLRAAFREHRVEKVYRAIVAGLLTGEGSAEVELAVVQHRPARVAVVRAFAPGERTPAGTRVAGMRWRALEHRHGATLLEVRPRTGFLHQIRATLAWLGHPVCGDTRYGGPPDASGAPRHLLHAARVAALGIAAESPDPPDFATW